METKEHIKKEIAQLDAAFKAKLIGTNDYCAMLNSLLKQLKNK